MQAQNLPEAHCRIRRRSPLAHAPQIGVRGHAFEPGEKCSKSCFFNLFLEQRPGLQVA